MKRSSGVDTVREALAQYVFVSKYARYNAQHRRRETYTEAIERVLQMHIVQYGTAISKATESLVREQLLAQATLPAGRTLQFAGNAILTKNMRAYNCAASYCDRPRFFAEAFWMLLCGAGVGFSVQKHHVAKLPKLHTPLPGVRVFTVPDTIEGWADAVTELVQSYFERRATVVFDYTEIRPAGAPLSSSSGKAPGHGPLRRALDAIRAVLEACLAREQTHLRPVDCYDIVMHTAEAVRSGGVRRAATICLFSADDADMMEAKTGKWWKQNPQRARSNNSAIIVRGDTSKAVFAELLQAAQQGGEPGFVFVDDTETLTNPCGEISMVPHLHGVSGWSVCNLTSINFAAIKSRTEACRAATAAAILGTWQAGYTDTGYLGEVSRAIIERDALLGVSLTGMADNPALAFDDSLQREMAQCVRQANMETAAAIGIRAAARTTCVKPEGTQSLVVKAGNGIHPHHDTQYIRHVQANLADPPTAHFAKENPCAVVRHDSTTGDVVLAFPVEVAADSWTKRNVAALQHLQMVLDTQTAWVESGTVRGTVHHNVSNTVLVKQDEWKDVAEFIWQHQQGFAGVSLLPSSGDLDYPYAPFVSTRELSGEVRSQEMSLFYSLLADWQDVDYTEMIETEDTTTPLEQMACGGGACQI